MGYWNYRIVKHTNGNNNTLYSIKEIYYASDGTVNGYVDEPVVLSECSPSELKQLLKQCKHAMKKDVLEL